jgi:F0F1-type ATP synthase assembly protein I
MPSDNESWLRQSLQDAAPYLGLGMQLALSVLLFFFIGWWIDGAYGSGPFGMLIGLAVGITGGMIKFIRTVTSPGFKKEITRHDEHH